MILAKYNLTINLNIILDDSHYYVNKFKPIMKTKKYNIYINLSEILKIKINQKGD